jgi:hypothetical protein
VYPQLSSGPQQRHQLSELQPPQHGSLLNSRTRRRSQGLIYDSLCDHSFFLFSGSVVFYETDPDTRIFTNGLWIQILLYFCVFQNADKIKDFLSSLFATESSVH